MKKPITLLLTNCLGYYMKETIACFKASEKYDVRIVGLDMKDMQFNINGIDSFYQVPRSDDPNYFDIAFAIAKKEKADVVMPLHSKELVPFCEKRELLQKEGMLLAVPPLEGLKIANDKVLAYEHMKKTGLPTPLTLITRSAEEAIRFVTAHKDMLFVTKLPDSCGARGFHIIGADAPPTVAEQPICKPEALHTIVDGSGDVLIQTYLPGKEYTTDMVLHKGKCVAYYTKECSVMEHGVIRQATIVDRQDVSDLCIRFAESLGLEGNIGFDLKCDAQGSPMIIDVNPRITATIALGRYGGLNLPLLWLETLLGECPTHPITAKAGVTIVRQIADFYFEN